LEDELFDAMEREARRRDLPAVDVFVADRDTVGAARVRDRGYVLHHTSWILQLAPDTPVAGRVLPPGYTVRPFRPEDAEAAFAVVAEAFGEWMTGPPRTFADWDASVLHRPGVDTSAFRVATFAGRLVGVCVVFDAVGEAWVSQLAVHRDHRGRGVAQQLLAETYGAARERGLPAGGLSTDTRTGALDLYLRLGMRVLHTVHNWSRDLRR
jgi:ribosomal protein S18 acetylase RimI-like enzyme